MGNHGQLQAGQATHIMVLHSWALETLWLASTGRLMGTAQITPLPACSGNSRECLSHMEGFQPTTFLRVLILPLAIMGPSLDSIQNQL